MKPGERRKDKCVQHHTNLYRSVSSPGIVSSFEKDTEKREEVVVGGGVGGGGGGLFYGLPPMHSPEISSSSSSSSPSPAMAIIHPGYQERITTAAAAAAAAGSGGGKGRKRPGRKTRQAADGYGSSPDAHGTSPPYRNENMRGGYRIQAEQVDKEAPVRGTNNYASLLSSPSPSSIPNPTFTTKYAYDLPMGLPGGTSRASVSQQSSLITNESNHHVQLNNLPPPSPSFLSNSDVHSVKMTTTITTVSSMSPRFDGSKRESLNLLGVVSNPDDFSGNGYVDLVEPTSPVATLMPSFFSELSLNSLETNSRASTPKDLIVDTSLSPRIDLENGHLHNPSLSVGLPSSLLEEDLVSRSSARQLPAVGVLKTNVKSASKTSKGINNITLLRRPGMPAMAPRQFLLEKGLKKLPQSGLPDSPPLSFVRTLEASSQWKIVPTPPVQETLETPASSIASVGSNINEGLSGSSNRSGLSLPGSTFVPPRKSGTDGIQQPGSAPMRFTSPAKLYPEHWSPEEVNRAMEKGQVFCATLRVNSHNRSEAYITVEGIPLDILIEGSSAQNRAIEGDVVAVLLDQPSAWPRLKGGNTKQMSNESRSLGETVLKYTETEKGIIQSSSGLGDSLLNCDSLQDQHAMGFSSTVHAESTIRDQGLNGLLPQLQQRSKDICSRNHTQKDSGGKGGPYWQESTTIKPSGYSNGQLDPRVEAARKSVVRILRRPSNESTGQQAQQNGFESRTDIGEGWTGGGSVSVLGSTEMENKGAPRPSSADIGAKAAAALASLESLVALLPGKRPAGKVVAILEKSLRRETVVGFLELPQHAGNNKSGVGRGQASNLEDSPKKRKNLGLTMLVPVDNRWPKMMVFQAGLPNDLCQRLRDNDPTVSNELLAARVEGWRTDSHFPVAVIKQSLGQGGELEAQQKAILHEHAISSGNFSAASLACLLKVPWKIPVSEMKRRRNLLHLRVFSVDHSAAQGCAHALSIESFPDGAVRVGIHVADVSYFVNPQTALDQEAQTRSTSVSFIQHMLPMLPRVLCEDLCSLNPAVDRLAFSLMWDMNSLGDITNEWIGRTVVRSCAKLTYGHVQSMMEEACPDLEGIEPCEDILGFETGLPEVYGGHKWTDLVKDIRSLHRIAKNRRARRFQGGALKLDHTKLVFTLEEDGTPYESTMYNTRDSNLVVKEFLLLANTTVARVISNAFPDTALLRRHPEPSIRKLKEFEDFCSKIGFDLDSTSAGTLHTSLMKMQENFKHDPVLYSILMQYASKPMQSAKYFCSGEFKDKEDWAHYAHAVPLYTHFTSPLHRYPDIIVHRTLAAALEAEEALSSREVLTSRIKGSNQAVGGHPTVEESKSGVYTSSLSEREANSMLVGKQALEFVAMKHKLAGSAELMVLAARCNERRMASRSVKEASIKLNIWTMLKKNKQGLLSDARVLALGPKFMSLYICKFAMERRIYYEDIEGVTAEWFEATGTLVLDISSSKNISQRRANQTRNGKPQRTVADIATLVNPTDSSSSSPEQESYEDIIREVEERLAGRVLTDGTAEIPGGADQLASDAVVEPTVFPLTLRQFSSVPVSLHAIGGDNRPLDCAARLYVSSYASSG